MHPAVRSAECTDLVDYMGSAYLTYLQNSGKSGEESCRLHSVLPWRRCVPMTICHSPCGAAFAYQQNSRILIHQANGEMLSSFSCPYKASYISFSPTSFPDYFLLLVAYFPTGIVDVWILSKVGGMEDNEHLLHLQCTLRTLDNAPADVSRIGLDTVKWIPRSQHPSCQGKFPSLLISMENGLSTFVYSISDRTRHFLPSGPAHAKKGLVFHPSASMMAFLTRQEKDFVVVYSTLTYQELFRIELETVQAEDLEWMGDQLLVWDSYLETSAFWYNLLGTCMAQFSKKGPKQLGIKAVDCSPVGYMSAFGTYDETLYIVSREGKVIAREAIGAILPYHYPAIVYSESHEDGGNIIYKVQDLPFLIPSQPLPEVKKGSEFPQFGIGLVKWSSDGRYVAFRNDNMARALWIYDVLHRSCVAVLVHRQHVINAHWDPVSPRLALCTGTDLLFVWSPEGSTCIPCDSEGFEVLDLLWQPQGSSILLLGASSFAVAYL